MSNDDRLSRKFLLREAEGCLELAFVCTGPIASSPDLAQGMARRALSCLTPLLPHRARRAHVLFLMGQSYQVLCEYLAALDVLRQSQQLDPDRLEVYLALGWCYKRTGRLDQAIASLKEALTIDGGSAITHYNLACYWGLAGDAHQAAQHVGTAVEIDPTYRDLIPEESDFDLVRGHPSFRAALTVVA